VVPDALESLLVRALMRLWNAELRLDAMPLEAPDAPPRLLSNSLLVDSVARLVSAATVEPRVEFELAVELEGLATPAAAPEEFARFDGLAACPVPILPIDIMVSIATPRN
jgi:hypothetical protein